MNAFIMQNNSINKNFNNINKRHIYNVENYIIIENMKKRFTQFFLHIYQNKKYGFFFINVIKSCFVNDNS